jgi:hypothetical protein
MTERPDGWMESMLVAYVDGQLDPADRPAVEEMIRANPDARAMVEALTRSASAVRNAFDRPLHEPVPARLLAAVGAAGQSALAGNVTTLRRPRRPRAWMGPLAALAASIAMLFVGVGVGYMRFAPGQGIRPAGTDSGPFETTLYRALERDVPGSAVFYEDAAHGRSGEVTLVGKVETGLGLACRAFRHGWKEAGVDQVEVGIACRSASGEWSVLTLPREPAG